MTSMLAHPTQNNRTPLRFVGCGERLSNDCVGLNSGREAAEGPKRATPGEFTARYGWSRCKPGAQSPFIVLALMLWSLVVVVSIGLFLSL